MLRKLFVFLSFFLITAAYGQQWFPLGTGLSDSLTLDTAVAYMYNDTVENVLYVTGQFTHINGVRARYIAKWDGQQWSSLGNCFDTSVVAINSICRYNGDLYVAGYFVSFNNHRYNHIARWDGQQWHDLDGGIEGAPNNIIFSMTVFQNELYVAGRFASAGGVYLSAGIAKWNGQQWDAVGDTLGGVGEVTALAVIHDTLVMAGGFVNIQTDTGLFYANFIVGWDGNNWITMGNGLSSYANALTLHNGKLYAGGPFVFPGNRVARWDGQDWQPVGSGLDDGYVLCLNSYNGNLVAGGQFFNAGGNPVNFIAQWDGQNWTDIGGGMASSFSLVYPQVFAVQEYGGRLYAGGYFGYAGNVRCSRIAVWPSPVGVVETEQNAGVLFTVFPNPASDVLVFQVSDAANVPQQIILRDALGRVVRKESVTQHNSWHQINVVALPEGLYTYEITDHQNLRQTGRVVIQHP